MNTPTYSTIISPDSYNRLMSVHRYIPESDRAILEQVQKYRSQKEVNILEVGCGPARILPLLATIPNATVLGVDHDKTFVEYAKQKITDLDLKNTSIIESDILAMNTDHRFDIVVSQGFHHHIDKKDVHRVLTKIHELLTPDGVYILSDEFLPPYTNEKERRRNVVVWYSHIIASALTDGENELAIEESKTLLDDLGLGLKTPEQIDLVLRSVQTINENAMSNRVDEAHRLDEGFINVCQKLIPDHQSGDAKFDLSRGDYKIDHEHFVQEAATARFRIVESVTFGPLVPIGGMHVNVLRKEEQHR